MIKAILFAMLFALVGLVAFAFLVPLLFHGVDFRKLGAVSAPFSVLVFGLVGFIFGWRRQKRH
jgi:hypothetical protein